jgi:hypothetical protein
LGWAVVSFVILANLLRLPPDTRVPESQKGLFYFLIYIGPSTAIIAAVVLLWRLAKKAWAWADSLDDKSLRNQRRVAAIVAIAATLPIAGFVLTIMLLIISMLTFELR